MPVRSSITGYAVVELPLMVLLVNSYLVPVAAPRQPMQMAGASPLLPEIVLLVTTRFPALATSMALPPGVPPFAVTLFPLIVELSIVVVPEPLMVIPEPMVPLPSFKTKSCNSRVEPDDGKLTVTSHPLPCVKCWNVMPLTAMATVPAPLMFHASLTLAELPPSTIVVPDPAPLTVVDA